MAAYIARRLLHVLVVLFVVSVVTFGLMHSVPGGPFDREKALPKEMIENLNARYHLDDPLWKQYLQYMYDVMIPHFTITPPTNALTDDFLVEFKIGAVWFRWMNFGPSFFSRSRTVNDIFRDNLPISAQLGVMAILVALVIGVPLGIIAGLKQNSMLDYLSMGVAIVGVSVPVIVLGPLLIYVFGVNLGWLPPTGWGTKPPYMLGFLPDKWGWDFFKYAVMPSISLGLGSSAIIARLMRASLLQTIREDYIRTARAKGLRESRVISRHALKNSLIPVTTILGPLFAALVTGTFVAEQIFGIPGMGRYFVTSISNRDYPVIMGTILLYAFLLVISNLVVDIAYGFLDPRIRYE
jgi:ABC-type dipeptide/oligopeptide/nickel transport system permease component